jgi:hypothetical protein
MRYPPIARDLDYSKRHKPYSLGSSLAPTRITAIHKKNDMAMPASSRLALGKEVSELWLWMNILADALSQAKDTSHP